MKLKGGSTCYGFVGSDLRQDRGKTDKAKWGYRRSGFGMEEEDGKSYASDKGLSKRLKREG